MRINPNELMNQVQALFGKGQAEQAFNLLKNTLKEDPTFMEAWMLLASIHRTAGDITSAIEICEDAIKYVPNPSMIYSNLSQLYIENNQFEKAVETIKKSVQADPKNASAWFALGKIFMKKEEFPHAIDALQKAVNINPNRLEIWAALAFGLDDNMEYKRSIKAFKRALEIDPSDFDSLVGIAMSYVNNEDYKQAIKAFEKATKINPKEPVVWFRLGTTLSKAGKLNKAIEAIKTGLDLDPSIVQAWMGLQKVYEKKGDMEKAGWAFRKAMGTGKVDVKFAYDEKEAISKIKEWEEEQQKGESESGVNMEDDSNLEEILEDYSIDSPGERKLFTSWKLRIPSNYEEQLDGNRVQLMSPHGGRCITASALTFEGNVPPDIESSIIARYEQAGLKLHSKIKRGNLHGHVFENDQYLHMGSFVIQCTIAAPSRMLMLTFSIPDTKEDKDWALHVIDTVELYLD